MCVVGTEGRGERTGREWEAQIFPANKEKERQT